MILRGNHTQNLCGRVGRSVPTRLPFHQDEFDVVLNPRIRLVGFSKKTRRTILNLVRGIRNLVPNDGGQVIKSQLAAMLLNRGMERNHGVPATIFPPGETHVADHTNKASAWNERPKALLPNFI